MSGGASARGVLVDGHSSGLTLTDDLGGHTDAFLRLAELASAAYDAFVFRDTELTRRFYDELYRRGAADFAPPSGRLLLVDGAPAGMFALVPPAVVTRSRLRGGLVVARSAEVRADPALGERMRLASSTFVRPLETDGYLSRIAVAPAMAGRGLGRLLLAEALAATRALGLTRCVLEVADTNERAAALYRRAGFEAIGHVATHDPERGASLGYLHMAYTV